LEAPGLEEMERQSQNGFMKLQKGAQMEFEYIDIKDFNLPLFDEPAPQSLAQYGKDHTKAWSAKIDSFDAFTFVTPE
jgi:NAD(P)H-dependent FMN reductase